MMQKPLVFNSTPLIYLTKVSLIHLLKEIPDKKITTSKVYHEIVVEGKKKAAPEALLLEKLFKEKVISVQESKDKEFLRTLVGVAAQLEGQPLHEAEAEILVIASEVKGVAIADDNVARTVASLFGIELHGTGYFLGKLYSTGKIKKEKLIQKVEKMREQGWYIAAEDYLNIIKYLETLEQ